MNIRLILKDIIYECLKLIDINIDKDIIIIEVPKNSNNGDFSCNIAMKLTKLLRDNPINIANSIKNELEKREEIYKVEIASPGFINIYLQSQYIIKLVKSIIESKDYGSVNYGNNKSVNIEFVSANPTGILHLGTARGAAYGENLANIMKYAGYNVTKEYYINDAGNQIDNLGLSIKERYKGICKLNEQMPKDGYYGKEIIDIAKKIYSEYDNNKLDEDIEFFKKTGVDYLLNIIKNDLENFGVSFDVWTSEKEIRKKGRIEDSLSIFEKKGLVYEKENAKWLKTTLYGDDKDRVLIKSDRSLTYLVPDIAYHLDKFDRGYDYLIDVFGSDHHSYVSRLKASIEALGYDKDKLEVKLLQMVRLLRTNEVVKMSKRTGKTVTISELLSDVGKSPARYFFASRSLDGQMDFDIDLAVKKSNDNPYFYVAYAHARICSILKEAAKRNLNFDYDIKDIYDEQVKRILLKVDEFSFIVLNAAIKKEPHLITNYVYELASMFHNYYGSHKMLTDDRIISSKNISFIKTIQITIKNALKLIGVDAPEKM